MVGTTVSHYRILASFVAADDQKRRVVYDTGHNIPRPDLIRESLDWLDKQLGAVRN